MQDLQEVTQEVHYENYRSERLAKASRSNGTNAPKITNGNGHGHLAKEEVFDEVDTNEKDRILKEKEAELKRMQEMLAQMQAKMQAQQQ
jgi:septin 2